MKDLKYIAYINDKMIGFSDVYSPLEGPEYPGIRILSEASYSIKKVILKLIQKEEWKGVIYLSSSPKRSWDEFVSHFVLQEASGGLVQNELNEFLVIYRRGKWDLPKGKIDYDESPEEAALREVKEECGVRELEINSKLAVTFHSYPHKSKQVLKKTHWYLMKTNSDELLIPQAEEDIEQVKWMSEKNIKTEFYSNTYSSIKNLLDNYFD